MEIIVPAAGLSSRFPGMRPKYLLYDYTGKLMLWRALAPYLGTYNITIGILKEHDEKYHASEAIKYDFGGYDVNIVVLDKETKGPAATAYQIIRKAFPFNINDSIFIKDCDSFFSPPNFDGGNAICTVELEKHPNLRNVAAKSFVACNDNDVVVDMVEKVVVSNRISVGGYLFESATEYLECVEELVHNTEELFVSDIIQRFLQLGRIFIAKNVDHYVDVGTKEDWFEYNDKPVIICDVDGTIIKNQGRVGDNHYLTDPILLLNSITRLKELENKGAQLIFMTSRSEDFRPQTEYLLSAYFKRYQLIMGVNNSRRILINDFNETNPHPRAVAINVRRDMDELKDYL
jgi:hypothetical protein